MALSARIFGVQRVEHAVPQALVGVAAVGLLYATRAPLAGRAPRCSPALVLALTPVAVLMFRYNNPDAAAGAAARRGRLRVVPGGRDGRTRWLLLAGGARRLAFLTKMLQAFLVVAGVRAGLPDRRADDAAAAGIWQLLAAARRCVVVRRLVDGAGGAVAGRSRPYIGGSTDNTRPGS